MDIKRFTSSPIKREIVSKQVITEKPKEMIEKKEDDSVSEKSVFFKTTDNSKYFNIVPKKYFWIGASALTLLVGFVLYKKFKK